MINHFIIRYERLEGEDVFHRVNPDSVGQYIGITDDKQTKKHPNGQYIFEGDIIKAWDTEINDWIIAPVMQRTDYYFYGVGSTLFDELTKIEVIGNLTDDV